LLGERGLAPWQGGGFQPLAGVTVITASSAGKVIVTVTGFGSGPHQGRYQYSVVRAVPVCGGRVIAVWGSGRGRWLNCWPGTWRKPRSLPSAAVTVTDGTPSTEHGWPEMLVTVSGTSVAIPLAPSRSLGAQQAGRAGDLAGTGDAGMELGLRTWGIASVDMQRSAGKGADHAGDLPVHVAWAGRRAGGHAEPHRKAHGLVCRNPGLRAAVEGEDYLPGPAKALLVTRAGVSTMSVPVGLVRAAT